MVTTVAQRYYEELTWRFVERMKTHSPQTAWEEGLSHAYTILRDECRRAGIPWLEGIPQEAPQ